MRVCRAARRELRGQAIVEFLLVGPLLLLLAFGIFDFGRGMSANVTVTNGSREGARYLAVNATAKGSANNYGTACYGTGANPTSPAADSAQGKAWRQLQNASLDLTQVTMSVRFYSVAAGHDPASGGTADVSISCSGGSVVMSNPGSYKVVSGDWLQFEVDYHYAPSTPLISRIVSQVTMNRITTMVVE